MHVYLVILSLLYLHTYSFHLHFLPYPFPSLPFTPNLFSIPLYLFSFCCLPRFHLILSLLLYFLSIFSPSLFYTILCQFPFPLVILALLSVFFSLSCLLKTKDINTLEFALRIGCFSPLPGLLCRFFIS